MNRATIKHRAPVLLWVAAIAAGIYGVSVRTGPPASALPVPAVGDTLDLDIIRTTFQLDASIAPSTWILVLSSSCPACLSLTTELETIDYAAKCSGAALKPVIVVYGEPADSMRLNLARHNLTLGGIADQSGFKALQTWIVPTVIAVSAEGLVQSVMNPSLPGTWPPTAANCGARSAENASADPVPAPRPR